MDEQNWAAARATRLDEVKLYASASRDSLVLDHGCCLPMVLPNDQRSPAAARLVVRPSGATHVRPPLQRRHTDASRRRNRAALPHRMSAFCSVVKKSAARMALMPSCG